MSFEIDIKANDKAKTTYHVSFAGFPQYFGDRVNMYHMRCTCPTANEGYWRQNVCPHKAMLFMKMYEEIGQIMLKEGNNAYYKRLRTWHGEQLEKKRLQGIRGNRQEIPVKQVFQQAVKSSSFVSYDLDRILDGLVTIGYYAELYPKVKETYGSGIQEENERGNRKISGTLHLATEEALFQVQ